MFGKNAQRSCYSIFVKFRRSRLALRRGIVRREEALAIAEELRAGRFHDRDDIFVIKEPEGTVVDASTPEETPAAEPVARASPEPRPPAPPPAPSVPRAPRPPAPPPRPSSPSLAGAARDLSSILALAERLDRMRRAMASASSASARVDQALREATGTLSAGGREVPVDLLRNHQRLRVVHEASAAAAASCERVALLLERRVQLAWAEVAPPWQLLGGRAPAPPNRLDRAPRFPRSLRAV
jgi:hypothetical protein